MTLFASSPRAQQLLRTFTRCSALIAGGAAIALSVG